MTAFRVNPETQFVEPTGKLTADGFNALQQIADAAEAEGPVVTPGAGIADDWSGNIKTVSDKTITLVQETSFAGAVSKTTTQSAAGTATFTFKINGVSFDGTANDVSTVEQSQVHTSTFAIGDLIAVTISASSSCEDAAFTIHYTRS